MAHTNDPILVLNKNWTAIRLTTVEKAFKKTISGKAKLIDEKTSLTYTWDEWIEQFSIPVSENLEDWDFGYDYIQSTSLWVRSPRVVVFSGYNKVPKMKVRLTRKNVFIRDRLVCQYSGRKLKFKEATIDHIIPKSRGGRTSWDNLVTCHIEVNSKKANKTPEEAGLKLLKMPKIPGWSPLYSKYGGTFYECWKKFVDVDDELLLSVPSIPDNVKVE